jgi:hypothetical protein
MGKKKGRYIWAGTLISAMYLNNVIDNEYEGGLPQRPNGTDTITES